MSYKNPRIIDDKSGLIVSQAIEKASGTLAQGIAVFGAEEKRREEVLEKENKRRDAVFIGLANEMAEDSALFNAGLEKGSSELRSVLIPRNEGLLKEINSIDIQQQINGNKDPRLSKRRSDLVSQISNGNTFAKSYIETASNLTEIMKDPQAFQIGQKTYVERNGSKDESEAILLATGGDPNFVTSFGDDLSITVTNKKSGEFFKNSREEFESKSKNLYITKNHNTAVQETELMRGGIYNEDGSVNYLLLKDMGSATPDSNEDTPGYITNYNVQTLNKNAVNNIKEESIDKTLAAIESYTSKQKQALYLKDIGITDNKLEDYQNGDNGKRRELIKESSNLIFKKNSGITLDDNNNYVIKTQIGNPTKITYSNPSDKEKAAFYWKNNTTNLFATTKLGAEDTNNRTAKSIMPEVLPVQIGSSFQGGKITNLKWGADSVIVSYSGSSDVAADPNAPSTFSVANAPSTPGSVTLKYNNVTNMTTLAESVGGSLSDPRAARVLAVQIANNNK